MVLVRLLDHGQKNLTETNVLAYFWRSVNDEEKKSLITLPPVFENLK